MPEHLLNNLGIRPRLDREAGRGVPQLMGCEPGQADPFGRGIKEAGPKVGVPEHNRRWAK
jgi:hypothetical protein